MIFSWYFWTFHDIPGLGKHGFLCSDSQVTYLGCIMDETMSGETMALKVINKINGKLKFLDQKYMLLSYCYCYHCY